MFWSLELIDATFGQSLLKTNKVSLEKKYLFKINSLHSESKIYYNTKYNFE